MRVLISAYHEFYTFWLGRKRTELGDVLKLAALVFSYTADFVLLIYIWVVFLNTLKKQYDKARPSISKVDNLRQVILIVIISNFPAKKPGVIFMVQYAYTPLIPTSQFNNQRFINRHYNLIFR